MHESDRNRLSKLQTALLLAASDFDQAAAAAARALDAEEEDLALMRALETAIAICYSRAFSEDMGIWARRAARLSHPRLPFAGNTAATTGLLSAQSGGEDRTRRVQG